MPGSTLWLDNAPDNSAGLSGYPQRYPLIYRGDLPQSGESDRIIFEPGIASAIGIFKVRAAFEFALVREGAGPDAQEAEGVNHE